MHPLRRLLIRLFYPFTPKSPAALQTPTGFFTDTTICIGCKACEVACKEWNELPADGLAWTGNSYDNTGSLSATSWRHVKFIEQFPTDTRTPLTVLPPVEAGRWLMMSDACKHCVTAPCQQACPTDAIVANEFANVFIQPDICNGCTYCVAACPFGVITRDPTDGHAYKCTLCYDRQQADMVPACAKACPTQSIQFGPIDELREAARHRVDRLHEQGETDAYLYGDSETSAYSALGAFYLLVDRPAVYGLPDAPVNPWRHMAGDYIRAAVALLIAIAAFITVLLVTTSEGP